MATDINISENELIIDVPPPMAKFDGATRLHPQNEQLLESAHDTRKLTRKDLKRKQKALKQLQQQLDANDTDALLTEYERVKLRIAQLKSALPHADDLLTIRVALLASSPATQTAFVWRLVLEAVRVRSRLMNEARATVQRANELTEQLTPLRALIIRRDRVRAILRNHQQALEDQEEQKILLKRQDQEARHFAEMIIRTWSRLGFNSKHTVRNKTVVHRPSFEQAWITEDQIIFKLDVTRKGLFGFRDNLPDGVYTADLISDKVLSECSSACEREIWSPHTHEQKWTTANGVYIVMNRLSTASNILEKVAYRAMMSRYPMDKHSKLPIPGGLRGSLRVNWVYLDSPLGCHMLVSGITGSGKSNSMRAFLACLVEMQSPRDVRYILVDLKRQGDFREFGDAPHCLPYRDDQPIVGETTEMLEVMESVYSEMKRRQIMMSEIGHDIGRYNSRVSDDQRLAHIIVVVDEFAATRNKYDKNSTERIDQLCMWISQQGRASGIHLLIGSQQTKNTVITPEMRDNMTTSFVGRQAAMGAAMSATGNRDAMKIQEIPGRMLCFHGASQYLVQMPLISDDDVRRVVNGAIDKYEPEPYALPEPPKQLSDTEKLVKVVLEQLSGKLDTEAIYYGLEEIDLTKKKIEFIVKKIIHDGFVMYDGMKFQANQYADDMYYLDASF